MQQLIRIGTISTVTPSAGTVRVAFTDRDDMVSGELPVLSVGGIFTMPVVGDAAVCLFLSDHVGTGFYLGTFYDGESVPDASNGPVVDGNLLIDGNLLVNGQISGDES